MKTLQGKLQTWTLNPADSTAGRIYLNTNINYGLLRQYSCVDVYDPFNGTGQQRVAKNKHKSKLRDAFSNLQYTPQTFNLSTTELNQVDIDQKGNVSITLDENAKLLILDGGTRFSALEEIRSTNTKNARLVDNLPIPVIIYLDNHHKEDFLNLNAGTNVNRSHILNMLLDNGRVPAEKLDIYKRARSLAQLLHSNENSPLCGKVQFGHIVDDSSLAFTVLCTDHASNIIASLFGTAKLLDVNEKDDQWFLEFFTNLYNLIKNKTECVAPKKLLALPPDGAKTNIHNILSVANVTMYYLYLQGVVNRPDTLNDNESHIIKCLQLYNHLVAGDSSRRRRIELTQAYTQKLFIGLDEDPELDQMNICFHHGIPLGLLVKTKYSGFGVDAPPTEKKPKGGKSSVPTKVEDVTQTTKDSDCTDDWDDE